MFIDTHNETRNLQIIFYYDIIIVMYFLETIKELNIVEDIRKLVHYNGVCLS